FFEAYGSAAGAAGVPRLERLLNGRGWLGRRETEEVRACAALALGRIPVPAAKQALASAAGDPDPVVRNAVSRAIRGLSA
ncbi:MAG: HEAT repeat domain-containing protein, partial [Gemmatimonadota bacterium]|nr:HEAT repeat domain-containing protein [Gemmatimonadota bacterium]